MGYARCEREASARSAVRANHRLAVTPSTCRIGHDGLCSWTREVRMSTMAAPLADHLILMTGEHGLPMDRSFFERSAST